MGLTKDNLYDLYDGSWEQKFTERFDKDVFRIRGLKPEEALHTLTEEVITSKVADVSDKIVRLDNGDLGIRKEVLELGLTERYQGLRNKLELIGNSEEVASQELVNKVLGLAPKEILLLSLNTETSEDVLSYLTRLTEVLLTTEDKMNSELLYFIFNVLSTDTGLVTLKETLVGVIDRLEMLTSYVYEERYYNPENLTRSIGEALTGDVKWGNVTEFPIEEYLYPLGVNGIYLTYLDKIKPMKETKALTKIWEDDFIKEILDTRRDTKDEVGEIETDDESRQTFESGKYIFSNNNLVLFRDGVTIVEQTGEFNHIPSSKVTKTIKSDLVERLKKLY